MKPSDLTTYETAPGFTKPEEWKTTPPAKDPVQGAGGVEYLNWAASHMADDEFSDTYAHRADHLINLHGDLLQPETAERLEGLI